LSASPEAVGDSSSPRWLKHLTLTAVSYVFYGWANPGKLSILAGIIREQTAK
jgi:hypothetical protein